MSAREETVLEIPLGDVTLEGALTAPDDTSGTVVFAHGSGSSRLSPRNNFVAGVIRDRGVGTLLFDLLTESEDQSRDNRFDIPLLTGRLLAVTEWLTMREDGSERPIGYFGSSTGAAAALRAAARRPDTGAVVSRGGRVDLAEDALEAVECPTMFIVGGEDSQVLRLNRTAQTKLGGENELIVIEGAGHLFEGPGELKEVARIAANWFATHLG